MLYYRAGDTYIEATMANLLPWDMAVAVEDCSRVKSDWPLQLSKGPEPTAFGHIKSFRPQQNS